MSKRRVRPCSTARIRDSGRASGVVSGCMGTHLPLPIHMLAIPNTDARWHGTWLNLEQQKQGAEEGGRGNQHTNVVIPYFEGFPKESNHQTAHCMAAQFKVSRATMERNARYADQINTIAEQTEKT